MRSLIMTQQVPIIKCYDPLQYPILQKKLRNWFVDLSISINWLIDSLIDWLINRLTERWSIFVFITDHAVTDLFDDKITDYDMD